MSKLVPKQIFCYVATPPISRLTSRKAKKKQAVRDERVSYLQVAPLWNLLTF